MSDLISRQAVMECFKKWRPYMATRLCEFEKELTAITSVENKGEWIYDKSIYNWRCSRCGQTPPPTGYVGTADFMATHFKFCNHCGSDMRGEADGK